MTRLEALKKVIKPRTIVVLILLLAANTFAWFIYASHVDVDLTAHVRAWKILFESGDSPIVDYVSVDVGDLYPGMQQFYYQIDAYNRSEVSAKLSYTIMEVSVLGTTYKSIEAKTEASEIIELEDLSSDDLIDMLENDYPFSIVFDLTSELIDSDIGEASFTIKVNWAFESGDDVLDTYWGNKASEYKDSYPSSPSITMKIKLAITQGID